MDFGGDTMKYRRGPEAESQLAEVRVGESYAVNMAAQLVERDHIFGSPVLAKITSGEATFAVLDTRWNKDRAGTDIVVVQEIEDGQYWARTMGVNAGSSARVGWKHSRKTFLLGEANANEDFDIAFGLNGLLITNLDPSKNLIIEAPTAHGRMSGKVINTPDNFEGALLSPKRTYRLVDGETGSVQPAGPAFDLRERIARFADADVIADRVRRAGRGILRAFDGLLDAVDLDFEPALRRLSPAESLSILNNTEIHAGRYKDQQLTTETLWQNGLEPKHFVELDGVNIYFSDTYTFGRRQAVVGYVESPDGEIVARTFYLSNSQCLWRYLPSYIDEPERRWYAKGHSQDSLNLPIEAQAALAKISAKGGKYVKDASLVFFGTATDLASGGGQTYNAEVEPDPLRLNGKFYAPGSHVVQPKIVDFKRGDEDLLAPDFSRRLRKWQQLSPYLGKVTMEVFAANNGIDKHIMGRVKVRREKRGFAAGMEGHGPVMTTGLRPQWVSGGDYYMPLIEYRDESGGYGTGDVDEERHYTDMWPKYLALVPHIRRYLASLN